MIHLQGGAASPILNDGGIYSIPIPWKIRSPNKYKDLVIQNKKALDLFSFMKCNTHLDYKYCHYDPDLRDKRGLFGQANAAQTSSTTMMLSKMIFLFFGWFKKYTRDNKRFASYFWMATSGKKIIKGDSHINDFRKENITHPHGHMHNKIFKNNTIYVGARDLKINNSLLKNKGLRYVY